MRGEGGEDRGGGRQQEVVVVVMEEEGQSLHVNQLQGRICQRASGATPTQPRFDECVASVMFLIYSGGGG